MNRLECFYNCSLQKKIAHYFTKDMDLKPFLLLKVTIYSPLGSGFTGMVS
jgi:hypothetical protein